MKVINSRKKKDFLKTLLIILASTFTLSACGSLDRESTVIAEEYSLSESELAIAEENYVQEEFNGEPVEPSDITVEELVKPEVIEVEEEEEIIEPIIEEIPRKLVALTFDDGPSKYTSELVDILDENNANATFFLIGQNIPANSDAVVKAYEYGNEIAIHTYTHKAFTKMSIEDIKAEIDLTRSIIEELEVTPANLVRPPYGSINDNIRDNIGTSFILWSVDTRDWESRNVEAIKEEVYTAINEGDIILFHDVYPTTIEAVKELLPELSEEYEFVTVSELYNRYEQTLEQNTKYYQLKK